MLWRDRKKMSQIIDAVKAALHIVRIMPYYLNGASLIYREEGMDHRTDPIVVLVSRVSMPVEGVYLCIPSNSPLTGKLNL